MDAILAVVAVDPSATSATGKREKNLFFCGNFPPLKPKESLQVFSARFGKEREKESLVDPRDRERERESLIIVKSGKEC